MSTTTPEPTATLLTRPDEIHYDGDPMLPNGWILAQIIDAEGDEVGSWHSAAVTADPDEWATIMNRELTGYGWARTAPYGPDGTAPVRRIATAAQA